MNATTRRRDTADLDRPAHADHDGPARAARSADATRAGTAPRPAGPTLRRPRATLPIVAVVAIAAAAAAAVPLRTAHAQEGEPAFDDLRTPASPAFILLGVSPTTIARPTTPRALGLSLLSATGDLGSLPRNYALEFAPYWLTPREALLFEEYYSPTPGQSIAQTFTVSLASTQGTGADSLATNMAVGFRFMPLSGTPSAQADSVLAEIRERQRRMNQLTNDLLDAEDAGNDAEVQRIQGEIDRLEAENADASRAFAEANAERDGLRLEFAGALAGRFPGDAFDDGEVSRYALWATLGFRAAGSLDAALLARFIRNERGDGQNLAGLGGQLSYVGDDLTVAAEYVSRWAFDVSSVELDDDTTIGTITFESTYRLAANVEYRITDDIRLVGTFGKDFREADGPRRPLVAVLGLDLAFGKVPLRPGTGDAAATGVALR